MTDDELRQFIKATAIPLLERHVQRKIRFEKSLDGRWVNEVVQGTLLRFLEQDPQPLPIMPWLYAVANSILVDFFRLKKRRHIVSLDSLVEEPIAPSSEDPLLALDFGRIFLSLSEEEQQVLTLTIDKYTHEEIAILLNIPETTVAYRLRKAREQLRKDPRVMFILKKGGTQ